MRSPEEQGTVRVIETSAVMRADVSPDTILGLATDNAARNMRCHM